MSQNSRGVDWLHCNHCFRTGGQMGIVFFSSCGHVICQKCGTQEGAPATNCPICKAAARLIAVDKNLGPDIRIFFQKPYDVASHYMQQLKKVVDFQMSNRQRLQKYQQNRIVKMQKYAEGTGSQLKKMQDTAKQLYQEKQQLIEDLKSCKQQIHQLSQRCMVAEAKIRNQESRLDNLQPVHGSSDSGHSSMSMADFSSDAIGILTSTPLQGSTATRPTIHVSPIARSGVFSSMNSSLRRQQKTTFF